MDLFLRSALSKRTHAQLRDYAPGQHGQSARGKLSNYGVQLREKQKVKRIYGLLEKQFRNYFKKAAQAKGITGVELLKMLERRLDNAVYRAGLAVTRAQARQMVSHGSVTVNGRKVNIPSFQLKVDDKIGLKVKPARAKEIQEQFEKIRDAVAKQWIDVDEKQLSAVIRRYPERGDINFPVEEQLIVELYSK